MYRCESWTMKKAERRRIDAFKLCCQRTLFRVPRTARRSNQPVLKEINPEYLLERLMLKLKLQYFGHLTRKANSPEKTLMLGKIEGRRRRGWQRMRQLMISSTQWTRVWANSRRYWRTGKPGVLQSMGSQRVANNLATEQQQYIRNKVDRKCSCLEGPHVVEAGRDVQNKPSIHTTCWRQRALHKEQGKRVQESAGRGFTV